MPLFSFEMLAQVLGVGSASGARAALALLVVAGLGRAGYVSVPHSLAFLTSTPALGALGGLALLEEWLERDDDAQELLAALKYGVHGTGGLVASQLLIERAGLPLDGWPIAVGGAALALITHRLRTRLHDALRGIEAGIVSPRRWLAWIEAGGVVGIAAAIVLAPFLALLLVALAAAGGTALYLAQRAAERMRRRPCGACGHLARKEARRCPKCRGALEVERWLGDGALARFDGIAPAAKRD
jgi:hypothetical protein